METSIVLCGERHGFIAVLLIERPFEISAPSNKGRLERKIFFRDLSVAIRLGSLALASYNIHIASESSEAPSTVREAYAFV